MKNRTSRHTRPQYVCCSAAAESGDGVDPAILEAGKLGVFAFLISDALKLTTNLILLVIFHEYCYYIRGIPLAPQVAKLPNGRSRAHTN